MEVSLLEDFLAVANLGGFSKAAEQRNVTQPAFSRRIRTLEDWVGSPLFDRSTHRVVMTDAGKVFYPVAEGILRRLLQVRDEVSVICKPSAITLNIVSAHTLAFVFFPTWLSKLEDVASSCSIRLLPGNSETCEQLMQRGLFEFYLTYFHPSTPGPLSAPEFQRVNLAKERLIPVSAPSMDGGPMFSLPGSPEHSIPYLAYGPKSGIERIIRAVHRNNQDPVWLHEECSMTSGVLLKPLALQGWGVTWLVESLVQDELNSGKLLVAGDEKWCIDIDICIYRSSGTQKRATDQFWADVVAGKFGAD